MLLQTIVKGLPGRIKDQKKEADRDTADTLTVLMEEIKREEPRPAILKALSANLEPLEDYKGSCRSSAFSTESKITNLCGNWRG